ncbi:MAG TPA: hypothetical protein VN063_03490 [Methylophilaceae bacterium]|nr:hypothetical protein [Methylophilaceae bacterium]
MASKLITARQQMRSAQSFAFFSSLAVILMPAIIPMLLWIAASIFAYCAVACHPNPRVQAYLTKAGHRFYGLVGSLVVLLNFSSQMSKAAGGWFNFWLIVWIVSILVVVPLGIRDILRAKKEPWQDMQVEME